MFAGLECEKVVLSPMLEEKGLPIYWEGGFSEIEIVEYSNRFLTEGAVLLFDAEEYSAIGENWKGLSVCLFSNNRSYSFLKTMDPGVQFVTPYYPDELYGKIDIKERVNDVWLYPISLAFLEDVPDGFESKGVLLVHDGMRSGSQLDRALGMISGAVSVSNDVSRLDVRELRNQQELVRSFVGCEQIISVIVDPVLSELACRVAFEVDVKWVELPSVETSPHRKLALGSLSDVEFSDSISIEGSKLRNISSLVTCARVFDLMLVCREFPYTDLLGNDCIDSLSHLLGGTNQFIKIGSWPFCSYSLSALDAGCDDLLVALPTSALRTVGRLYLCQNSVDTYIVLFRRLLLHCSSFLGLLVEDACALLEKRAIFCNAVARIGYRIVNSNVDEAVLDAYNGPASCYFRALLQGDLRALVESQGSLLSAVPRANELGCVAALGVVRRGGSSVQQDWPIEFCSIVGSWGSDFVCDLAQDRGLWSFLCSCLDVEVSKEGLTYEQSILFRTSLAQFEHGILGDQSDNSGFLSFKKWLMIQLPVAISRWPHCRNLKHVLARVQISLGLIDDAIVTMYLDFQSDEDPRSIEGTVFFWAILAGREDCLETRVAELTPKDTYDSVHNLICAFVLCYIGDRRGSECFAESIDVDDLVAYSKNRYYALLCSAFCGLVLSDDASRYWQSKMYDLDNKMGVFIPFVEGIKTLKEGGFGAVRHVLNDILESDAFDL